MNSVVIPLCNEAENVPELCRQLAAGVAGTPGPWEFVLVDDGSRDGTWEALGAARQADPRVRPIRLKRNFGQTPALACGIDRARGDVIVTMDGDLQNDPADIPALLAKLAEGYDVVCGWRHQRQDKLITRRLPSLIANRLIGWLTGVRLHDYGCSLKAYRALVIKRTPLYGEFHRYVTALVTTTGALLTEVKVNHRPRRFGRTKYNLSRTWRVALDMFTIAVLTRFAVKPLRFFGTLSVLALAVGVVCLERVWHWYVAPVSSVPQVLPGAGMLSLWLAGHLAVVGLLAELTLATAHRRSHELVAPQEAA
jgi:glycosyltransferase involved in cell wall biosynthesis